MTAVSDEQMARLAQLEALRSITDNLKRLNDHAGEHSKLLHEMQVRLTRIESNKLDRRVEEMQSKIEALEADKNRRDGAISGLEWISKFGPWLAALALALVAIVGWDRAAP